MPNKPLQTSSTKLWTLRVRLTLLLCAGLMLLLIVVTVSGSADAVTKTGQVSVASSLEKPLAPEFNDALLLHAYVPEPRPHWATHAYPLLQPEELRAAEAEPWPVQDAVARIASARRTAGIKTEGFDPTGLESHMTGAFFVRSQDSKRVLLLLLETSDPQMVCHACSPWQSVFEFEKTQGGWTLQREYIAFDRIGSWGRSAPYLVLPSRHRGYVVAYDYDYLAQGVMTKHWIFYSPIAGVMQLLSTSPSWTSTGQDAS